MKSEDSYRNPFADYNANVMDASKILEYWYSPFSFKLSVNISEADIYTEVNPIVFMGGRGTGKTMFLKYFSYKVQKEAAKRKIQNNEYATFIDFFREKGGIGFYIRIDGPILRSFEGKGITQEKWGHIFTHYFELQACKMYLEVIQDIAKKGGIKNEQLLDVFVPKVANLLGEEGGKSRTIDDLLEEVESKLEEVTKFRGDIAFSDVKFEPKSGFGSQSLSFGITKIARETIDEFKDINFIIFIDEYENFLESQQRIINTLLKFVKPGITFRIGMRLESFHTFGTISEKEFIKEGRDYNKVTFENFLATDRDYRNFLIGIAKKRLESIQIFKEKDHLDISRFLGKRENFEKEAYELVNERDTHFHELKHAPGGFLNEEQLTIIRHPENPLLEMLNILWIMRSKKPEEVSKAMKDYLDGEDSAVARKYRRDYVDKYKLSLLFRLCSIYRKNKKYYSFNTFCFLSSGIVGNFIELCRRSFQYACFEDREKLLNEGIISCDHQNRAARDLAKSESEMIPRIQKCGDLLYRFTKNLGNIFREYHRDRLIRYPETNQFSVDYSSVEDEDIMKAFEAALEWSIIQKKPALQTTSPGTIREEIYTLNRIFSPLFNITYRTRGGFSEKYESSDLINLMTKEGVKPKMALKLRRKSRKKTTKTDGKTQRLSDFID